MASIAAFGGRSCVGRIPSPARTSSIGGSALFSNTQTANRLEFRAAYYGIDVIGFAVMSNHLHVVLRNRPDVVAAWSADEVARRWWFVFPQRRDNDGLAAQPEPHELAIIAADPKRLMEVRKRLASVSWFMRCLAEPIARQASYEDTCTGRFWERRFKCQPLLDESAVAACMVYVDLNPLRAGLAKTPEASQFTSAYERIQALQPVAVGQQREMKLPARRSRSRKTSRHQNSHEFCYW